MEPDVDPPLLPLQGPRVRPSTSTRSARATTPKTTSRQPARRPQQLPSQRGEISRLPASARSATRGATQARRLPPTTARRPVERNAPIPGPTKLAVGSTRDLPPTRSKPLVPVSERRTQGQTAALARTRTNSETERWDITPDGGSAGREGRQFTVANVGNNGRIYLR